MPDKPALRRRLRHELGHLPEATRTTASATLRDRLLAWPCFQQAPVVALFHSTATEPDLLPLLRNPGKTFLLPLCHPDRSLTWHRPLHLDRWRPGPFGIIEPDPSLSPPVAAASMALVLVPGLAFTPSGDRLGHGAGYYDRFLATLAPSVPTAGICFSCQILPTLPAAAHDIPVHHVLHA
ncbi:MAG: 5-formyltetrahydrofolate cyclo-ligase [Verrucomicrobiota bacterium]